MSKTDKQAAQIASLERDIASLKEVQEEQLGQREERHSKALERLTERKDVEKARDLLALRTEYQTKLEKANEGRPPSYGNFKSRSVSCNGQKITRTIKKVRLPAESLYCFIPLSYKNLIRRNLMKPTAGEISHYVAL